MHSHRQEQHQQCKARSNQCPHPTRPTNYQACPMQTNTAYCLGSAFNQTIKKLNKNIHVSFAKQHKVHLFDAMSTPSIMLTYDSGADGHYVSKHDQHKASLPILRPSTWQVGVANGAQAMPNTSPSSPFINYLHNQDKQTHSRTSPHL
jgi:hypothetical protein